MGSCTAHPFLHGMTWPAHPVPHGYDMTSTVHGMKYHHPISTFKLEYSNDQEDV